MTSRDRYVLLGTMGAKKKTSKSAFILGLPLDMPASEVIAKAAEAGVSITRAYVSAIRSSKRRASARRAGRHLPAGTGGASKNETMESRFVALALDVGLSRAEELIAKVRAQLPTFRI